MHSIHLCLVTVTTNIKEKKNAHRKEVNLTMWPLDQKGCVKMEYGLTTYKVFRPPQGSTQ